MSNNNDRLKKDVAKRLREVREKLQLKQEELAQQLGCSRSNLSQIENEAFLPGLGLLDKLKSKFKVRLDWLISGEGAMFTDEMERELEILDFGKYTGDVKLMLTEMKKSPVALYHILSDFYAYLGIEELKKKKIDNGNNGENNGVNNDD